MCLMSHYNTQSNVSIMPELRDCMGNVECEFPFEQHPLPTQNTLCGLRDNSTSVVLARVKHCFFNPVPCNEFIFSLMLVALWILLGLVYTLLKYGQSKFKTTH